MFISGSYVIIANKCCIQVVCSQDKEWSICYDGSSDRCKAPVCCTIIANPQPLVFAASDNQDLAKYGAKEHADEIKSEIEQLKQWHPPLIVTSIHTDNENTMRSMRDTYFEQYDSPGCASHGAQTILGLLHSNPSK